MHWRRPVFQRTAGDQRASLVRRSTRFIYDMALLLWLAVRLTEWDVGSLTYVWQVSWALEVDVEKRRLAFEKYSTRSVARIFANCAGKLSSSPHGLQNFSTCSAFLNGPSSSTLKDKAICSATDEECLHSGLQECLTSLHFTAAAKGLSLFSSTSWTGWAGRASRSSRRNFSKTPKKLLHKSHQLLRNSIFVSQKLLRKILTVNSSLHMYAHTHARTHACTHAHMEQTYSTQQPHTSTYSSHSVLYSTSHPACNNRLLHFLYTHTRSSCLFLRPEIHRKTNTTAIDTITTKLNKRDQIERNWFSEFCNPLKGFETTRPVFTLSKIHFANQIGKTFKTTHELCPCIYLQAAAWNLFLVEQLPLRCLCHTLAMPLQ